MEKTIERIDVIERVFDNLEVIETIKTDNEILDMLREKYNSETIDDFVIVNGKYFPRWSINPNNTPKYIAPEYNESWFWSIW